SVIRLTLNHKVEPGARALRRVGLGDRCVEIQRAPPLPFGVEGVVAQPAPKLADEFVEGSLLERRTVRTPLEERLRERRHPYGTLEIAEFLGQASEAVEGLCDSKLMSRRAQ